MSVAVGKMVDSDLGQKRGRGERFGGAVWGFRRKGVGGGTRVGNGGGDLLSLVGVDQRDDGQNGREKIGVAVVNGFSRRILSAETL